MQEVVPHLPFACSVTLGKSHNCDKPQLCYLQRKNDGNFIVRVKLYRTPENGRKQREATNEWKLRAGKCALFYSQGRKKKRLFPMGREFLPTALCLVTVCSKQSASYDSEFSPPFPSLPFPSLSFPSLLFPSSLPFSSIPFRSLAFLSFPFTSLPFHSLSFPSLQPGVLDKL